MADEKKRPDFHIDYIELHAGGVARTKKFYSDAFGWPFRDWGRSMPRLRKCEHVSEWDYERHRVRERRASLVILYASKLEEAQARIEKAGGKIVENRSSLLPRRATIPFRGSRR